MANIKYSGPLSLRLRALATISKIAIATSMRHAVGRKMAPDWDANFETGIRFIRHQFTTAMRGGDMVRGRLLFDAVQPETDDIYEVDTRDAEGINAIWYEPKTRKGDTVILYLHGGGYGFHGGVSARYAQMIAHHTGLRLFAPDYRLTPEHPHPAQADDAMAAWDYLAQSVPAKQVVVLGDSAGGHMTLMLSIALREQKKEQPMLCVGLCPWTDIGDRGASMTANDQYDLVQGWMAVMFGKWLDPKGTYGRKALSPISYNYEGLAPLYLQAGGREVLRDMVIDFEQVQKAHGADVMLDIWPDMPHNFQAYDSLKESSTQALQRICKAIEMRAAGQGPLPPLKDITVT
ncbi:alpha/beta hydrolase fold domain-containing protein [Planktotalea sp.]|uniref:alpha/beta hydrolase n=1 Tax=Planktotalea sp. TaxID=2029877 RepID=UPI0032983C9D